MKKVISSREQNMYAIFMTICMIIPKVKSFNFKKIIMLNEISILEVVEYTLYAQAFKQQKTK